MTTTPINASMPAKHGARATKAYYAANGAICNKGFGVHMISLGLGTGVSSIARKKRFAAKETGKIWLMNA